MQCLLDNLVMARDDSGQSMTSTALRDELMTLLVAGQETSAVLLAWCTAFLAYCPHVQARAAAEVAQVLQGEAPSSSNIRQDIKDHLKKNQTDFQLTGFKSS